MIFRDRKKSFLPKYQLSYKKSLKKKTKDITFTKKVWKNEVPGGNTDLFLTGHNLGTKNSSDEQFSEFYSPWYPLSDKTLFK